MYLLKVVFKLSSSQFPNGVESAKVAFKLIRNIMSLRQTAVLKQTNYAVYLVFGCLSIDYPVCVCV